MKTIIHLDTSTNQQTSEYSNVQLLTQTRINQQRHKKKDNLGKSRKVVAAKEFASNLKKRIVPTRKRYSNDSERKRVGCCCTSDTSSINDTNPGCCSALKRSRLGNLCNSFGNCLLNTMLPTDTPKPLEPLVTNGQVDRRRVCINIAGKRYETLESTLAKYPETLLALPQRELFFDSLNGEYFFDRNRKAFGAILTYCQTGVLVKPPNLDDRIFAAELRFFGFEAESQAHIPQNPVDEQKQLLPDNPILRKIWQLFEFPDTSFFARVVSLFSMSVILLSIVMFCLETLPEFKEPSYHIVRTNNTTTRLPTGNFVTKKAFAPVFFTVEAACIAWFTFEYALRLIASPKKFQFLYQPLNMIDLIAIIPFYIVVILSQTDASIGSLSILRVLRLVRVFRIFKLSRYSKGLKILGYTFRASLQELGLLAFFLLIGIILFASAAYYAEEQVKDTKFKSIIHGFWWAIVTMTTVGYGDMYPETLTGQLVGSFCVLVGVLAIAFPVPVIVNNFTYYYTLEQGAPEPLDEEYLETPLGNNRNSFLSSESLSSNEMDDSDHDFRDFNKNTTTKRRKQAGANGMIGVQPPTPPSTEESTPLHEIHFQIDTAV